MAAFRIALATCTWMQRRQPGLWHFGPGSTVIEGMSRDWGDSCNYRRRLGLQEVGRNVRASFPVKRLKWTVDGEQVPGAGLLETKLSFLCSIITGTLNTKRGNYQRCDLPRARQFSCWAILRLAYSARWKLIWASLEIVAVYCLFVILLKNCCRIDFHICFWVVELQVL